MADAIFADSQQVRSGLPVRQFAASRVDRGDVVGLGVSINLAKDGAGIKCCHCHDGDAFRVDRTGRRRSGEQTGH